MKYVSRWKGKSKEEVSAAMRALAVRKNRKMSVEEKQKLALKMVKGRGKFKKVNGKTVYVAKR